MSLNHSDIYYSSVVSHIVKYELFRHRSLLSKFPITINRTLTDVLAALCKSFYQNKTASTSDVYLYSGLSKSTVIASIKKLITAKIVIKSPAPGDRRRVAIKFTEPYQEILHNFVLDCSSELDPLSHMGPSLEECLSCEHSKSIIMTVLANISHEFRTPLNAISGYAEMMELGLAVKDNMAAYPQYASTIREASGHLLNLVNDILDLSQYDATSTIPIFSSPIQVEELIEACRQLVKPQAEKNNITVDMSIPHAIPTLFADERRIKQVLINLISNAVQYSPRNSTIIIESKLTDQNQILIGVNDSGPGISEKDIGTALEPFGRLKHHKEANMQGNGIGLPLSKSIMEIHGGELIFNSKSGGGLTVTAVFPADRSGPEISS